MSPIKPSPHELLAALERDCLAWEQAHPGEEVLWLLGRAVGLAKVVLATADDLKVHARRWFGLAHPVMPLKGPTDAAAAFIFGEALLTRAVTLGIEPDRILDELARVRALPRKDPIADCTLGEERFYGEAERGLRTSKMLADNGLCFAAGVFASSGPRMLSTPRMLPMVLDRTTWTLETVEPMVAGEELRGVTYQPDPAATVRARAEAYEIKELFDALMVFDAALAVRAFQHAAAQAERSVQPSRGIILERLLAALAAGAEASEHDNHAGRAA